MIAESVSIVEHNKLEGQMQLLQAKTRNLLERQTRWISEREEFAGESRKSVELAQRLERAERDLVKANCHVVTLEAALKRIGKDGVCRGCF